MASSNGLETVPGYILINEFVRRKEHIFCDCGGAFIRRDPTLSIHHSIHAIDKTYGRLQCEHTFGNAVQLQMHAIYEHGSAPAGLSFLPQ